MDRSDRVLIPCADPVPHYNRGRARVEPRLPLGCLDGRPVPRDMTGGGSGNDPASCGCPVTGGTIRHQRETCTARHLDRFTVPPGWFAGPAADRDDDQFDLGGAL